MLQCSLAPFGALPCSLDAPSYSLLLPLCSPMLPHAPPVLPRCSPGAPLLRPLAPLLLPLKRPCSLSRPGTAILDPKFGVYIIDIYYIHPELRIGDCPFRSRKGAGPL